MVAVFAAFALLEPPVKIGKPFLVWILGRIFSLLLAPLRLQFFRVDVLGFRRSHAFTAFVARFTLSGKTASRSHPFRFGAVAPFSRQIFAASFFEFVHFRGATIRSRTIFAGGATFHSPTGTSAGTTTGVRITANPIVSGSNTLFAGRSFSHSCSASGAAITRISAFYAVLSAIYSAICSGFA